MSEDDFKIDLLTINNSADNGKSKPSDKKSSDTAIDFPVKKKVNKRESDLNLKRGLKEEPMEKYCPIKSASYKNIDLGSPKRIKRRAKSPKASPRGNSPKTARAKSPVRGKFSDFCAAYKNGGKKRVHFVPDDMLVEVIEVPSYKKYNKFKFTTNVKGLRFIDDDKDDDLCNCFIY